MRQKELQKHLAEYQGLKPKKTVKTSKRQYRLEKKAFKQLKANKADKEALTEAKRQVTLKKRVYQHQVKRNGGSRKAKLAKKAHASSRKLAESAVADHDVMGDVASKRQSIRKAKYSFHKSKQLAKGAGKVGSYTVKAGYGLSNRFYNKVGGRGFARTPKADRWETALARRIKRLRMRIGRTKALKAGKTTFRVITFLTNPIKHILTNPLSLSSYVIVFVMMSLLALFMSDTGAMQQDEFALNKSWLHFSQMDRHHSNDKVDYWTAIDDVLHYTNFVYGDYVQEDTWGSDDDLKTRVAQYSPGATRKTDSVEHMSDMERQLWKALNGDKDHLKTMVDLYGSTSGSSYWRLSKERLSEYQELLEVAKEEGYYTAYQELENILYTDKERGYNDPLVITKRFGYVTDTKIYHKTIIQATKGKQLYAAMAGVVNLEGNNLTIETGEARFTYYDVSGLRVKTGDTVDTAQAIAVVANDNGQTISYQKQEEKATKDTKAKWTYVNAGFYFPRVTYNQTTSVMSDLEITGDLANRAKAVYDHIKKKIPKATDNGIAAMLGNFATESYIKAKRAESDYLNPPIGASSSSWDDDNWLNMGYAQGASVGSLVKHRGLGLGQWTDTFDGANRNTLLREYAASRGKKWYDLEIQIDFILEGDNPYYRQIAMGILTSNSDVATLTKRFLNQWEGNAGDKLLERQHHAEQMLMYFKMAVVGGGSLASSWNFPEAYRSKLEHPPTQAAMTTQQGSGYPVGQCTWYAYNRLVELGSIKDLSGAYGYLGNGQDWVRNLVAKGWRYSPTPIKGAVVSTAGGFDGTFAVWGHVGIVEVVNPDGSFLVSELNYAGIQDRIHYRVCRAAPFYSFATPN
ncbi:CHAP domain-containing protein [Streptococcus canis]|uniref:phage tail tip lysozyme n=1 Tax=Streptococcus canis TaxID=1329 RepID=UPI0013DD27E5|nr:phage tail tip lysozyme [Streptococcus canis]QKG74517.1 CHAP domain-containing protein [Streptococcus canis]